MSWADREHRKNKIQKLVDAAMKEPEYQEAVQKQMEKATEEAFDRFLLISADYLHRYCRYGKKRILQYLDFVVYQMHCIETDPEYFVLLNETLAEETGVDILKNLLR